MKGIQHQTVSLNEENSVQSVDDAFRWVEVRWCEGETSRPEEDGGNDIRRDSMTSMGVSPSWRTSPPAAHTLLQAVESRERNKE